MNLTPLQQRRLQQTKDEISFLEKQSKRKGLPLFLLITIVTIAGYFLVVLFLEVIIEKQTFKIAFANISWKRFVGECIFWVVFNLFLYGGNRSALKNKKKELIMLRKKYGIEEAEISTENNGSMQNA